MQFDMNDMTLDVTDPGGTWIDLDVVARKANVDRQSVIDMMLVVTASDAVRRQLAVAATNIMSDAVALGADEDVIEAGAQEALSSHGPDGRRLDAAMFVHDGSPCLTATECSTLMCLLEGTTAIPMTVAATDGKSFASGFVSEAYANEVEHITRTVTLILDDPSMRTPDGTYEISGGRIALLR